MCANLRVFYFPIFKIKKILYLPKILIQFWGGIKKKYYSSFYKFSSSKIAFIPCILNKNSHYFCTVKIKHFKHIHVHKNIKVEQFIEILHSQKVVGPWELKLNLFFIFFKIIKILIFAILEDSILKAWKYTTFELFLLKFTWCELKVLVHQSHHDVYHHYLHFSLKIYSTLNIFIITIILQRNYLRW